jgi:carbonic anhydrase
MCPWARFIFVKKLIEGIIEFRRTVRDGYKESFGRLATGQKPDSLFIACSDSRVVPNTFASTNPGDLFVLRNVGNMIPACDEHGVSVSDESEAAAIELSVIGLNVRDIIVCGHSECAAMRAIIRGRDGIQTPNLRNWLRHGEDAHAQLKSGFTLDPSLAEHNQLSQLNVLKQMEHVASYPAVRERLDKGTLRIHGWWFDISKADVYAFNKAAGRFVVIDESYSEY